MAIGVTAKRPLIPEEAKSSRIGQLSLQRRIQRLDHLWALLSQLFIFLWDSGDDTFDGRTIGTLGGTRRLIQHPARKIGVLPVDIELVSNRPLHVSPIGGGIGRRQRRSGFSHQPHGTLQDRHPL